jgi:hypothetical protein
MFFKKKFSRAVINKIEQKVVSDLITVACKDLQEIKKPADFDSTHAYNLILAMFQLKILNQEHPQKVYEQLHTLVDEAYKDFYDQINTPVEVN